MTRRVIIGLPRWSLDGAALFAERLVRVLGDADIDASVLLADDGESKGIASTEAELSDVASPPADLPCDWLRVGRGDAWGQRWEALERHLEERAPCVYLMLDDWGYNVVAPRLSRRVHLVGVVQADDAVALDHVERFGPYWNAIVATSDRIHFTLAARLPQLAGRMVTIRSGIPEPAEAGVAATPAGDGRNASMNDSMAAGYRDLFDRVERLERRRGFVRPRGLVLPPVHSLDGIGVAAAGSVEANLSYVNGMLAWPDPVRRSGAEGRGRAIAKAGGGSRRRSKATLADHRILVASSPGQISGVDVFASHLVRQLRGRGLDARLHGRRPADPTGPLAYPEDLPLDELDPALGEPSVVGWLNSWRALAAHLERLAPCIYIPNYDVDYSCACPLFSDSVRMVGIVHGDDPWHYEHLSRIGPFCDAVVGVSTAISRHVAALDPSYGDRLRTIPYGITLPASVRATDEERPPNAPLRIVFTGRLIRQQKRAEDVVAVALELAARGVPFEMIVVGNGTARGAMEWAGRRLILDRRLWFTGTLPNEDVLSILSSCDALLLPSAFEGLSVGMLEAMARGVVPVVSDIRSGVPDAVRHGENGFIAPVGDTSRFADHLQRLQQDHALRRRMAAAAAETIPAGRFQLEDMIDRYVDLFTWVVENPRSRPGGAVVPPGHLREEASWRLWARRIAADPLASIRRVANRLSRGGETGRRVSTGPPG